MAEPEILTEVPDDLKRLVRIIMRCFYGDDYAVVMDKLIHHPCIKEEQLLDLLRFERKQLRSVITTLRNEKFVRVRMRMETEPDPANNGTVKATRHNYYFISYSVFVNVVKYKLDHMRRKIETEEWDATSRASFICPECHKQFTDLEVDQLVDMRTGELRCTYCNAEVVEEATTQAGNDSRLTMAKFNEQIEPIFVLLRKVEDVRLSADILEPEPLEFKPTRVSGGSGRTADKTGGSWSGEASKSIAFGATESQITISMDARSGATAAAKPAKEVPLWIAQSTVEGAEIIEPQNVLPGSRLPAAVGDNVKDIDSDDIMRTLLSYEKKPAPLNAVLSTPNDRHSSSDSEEDADNSIQQKSLPRQSSQLSNDVEEMDTDEEGDEEMVVMVTIGDRRVPMHEVTEDMVAQMTPAEKAEYIRLGQEIYEQLYD